MAKDLEAPKPFVPSGFADGNKLDAGGVEEMRFGLAGSGPLAKAVLDSNAVGTMRQLVGGGATPTTTIPVGTISPYAGTSAPANWLLCDGSAVSRATYAALFDVTGTAYGAGDGSTTFNVPDLRGRVVVGSGTGAQQGAAGSGVITGGTALAARTRGQFFGDERTELHTHTQNAHGHEVRVNSFAGDRQIGLTNGGPDGAYYCVVDTAIDASNPNILIYAANNTATNQNTFAGTGANTQPSVVTTYIIKAVADVTNTFGVALSGVAGGELTGNYPNPTIAPIIATNLKVQNAAPTITISESTGAAFATLELTDRNTPIASEGTQLRYDSSTGNSYLRSTYSAGNLYLGSGSSSASQVSIDASGRVTNASQPVFSAAGAATRNAPNDLSAWGQVPVNVGSSFNAGNGRFTAPIAGRYFFTAAGFAEIAFPAPTEFLFYINGGAAYGSQYRGYSNIGNYSAVSSISAVFPLSAGDYVTCRVTANGFHSNAATNFTGFLFS